MELQQIYHTFTNPKVVTSMIIPGILLGIVLSLHIQHVTEPFWIPAAFVTICLVFTISFMH